MGQIRPFESKATLMWCRQTSGRILLTSMVKSKLPMKMKRLIGSVDTILFPMDENEP
jgi:hypothetical protein